MDTLTVVTLNLWHDSHEWPKRLPLIVTEMRRIRPDVLCLQEVLQHSSLRNQAETLADSLGCHVQFASVDGPERPKRYGNAILTRHRVLVSASRNLEPADDYRLDVPAIGPDTLARCVEGQAAVLAVESGGVLIVEPEAVASEARRAGISVVGVPGRTGAD